MRYSITSTGIGRTNCVANLFSIIFLRIVRAEPFQAPNTKDKYIWIKCLVILRFIVTKRPSQHRVPTQNWLVNVVYLNDGDGWRSVRTRFGKCSSFENGPNYKSFVMRLLKTGCFAYISLRHIHMKMNTNSKWIRPAAFPHGDIHRQRHQPCTTAGTIWERCFHGNFLASKCARLI